MLSIVSPAICLGIMILIGRESAGRNFISEAC